MNFGTYQKSLHRLLVHFCTKSIVSENRLSEYFTSLIAEQLAVSYKVLEGLPIIAPSVPIKIQTPPFLLKEYLKHKDHGYFSPLIAIYNIAENELNPFINGFYLHGSLATMDYVKGWSDVDTFVILSKATATNPDSLLKARLIFMKIQALMRKIDPLQHHGVIVTTAVDFKSYPEDILPLEVFRRMKMIYGRKAEMALGLRKDEMAFKHLKGLLEFVMEAGEKGVFESHAYNNEYLFSQYRNYQNGMYQLKYYLGQFLLLPSLYLTAIAENSYKKDSFEKVRSIFPKEVMEWIDLISDLRKKWGKKEGIKYLPNEIPSWVRKMVPQNYLEIGAYMAETLLKHIEEKVTMR